MGKPVPIYIGTLRLRVGAHTRGSKTFQYPEEKKSTSPTEFVLAGRYCVSSGERTRRSPEPRQVVGAVVREECGIYARKVTKLSVSRSRWKAAPQRVIVP